MAQDSRQLLIAGGAELIHPGGRVRAGPPRQHLALPGDMAIGLREQLAEELARLGSRIEEAAALDRVREGE